MQASEHQDQQKQFSKRKRNLIGRALNPIVFFVAWLIAEFCPALIPSDWNDDIYWTIYFYSEDISTVFLALSFYTALSYTSVILKGLSLTAVVISCGMMISNILLEVLGFPQTSAVALAISFMLVSLQLFMTRFIFRFEIGYVKPDPRKIYMIVDRPRNFLGMLGLFWSGLGGGFYAYVDGVCYKFSRKEGCLIKKFDPNRYIGRGIIDCGFATEENIADLEGLIGMKWSIWNNCFTVFGKWRRRWDGR